MLLHADPLQGGKVLSHIVSWRGFNLRDTLPDQDDDRILPWLVEDQLRPILVAVQHKPRPCRPAVAHRPEHGQAVATRRLCLFPRCPRYKFNEGPAERLPYAHGAHPGPFNMCD